jgi:hypothetical protein
MIGSDPITPVVLCIAVTAFFAILSVASLLGHPSEKFRLRLVALFACILPFLLYRQHAEYDQNPAPRDFDFGFPQRFITTQSDSNPVRFRSSSLVLDIAAGTGLWVILSTARRIQRRPQSKEIA